MIDISDKIDKSIKYGFFRCFPVLEYRDTVFREYGIIVEVRTKENNHGLPHVHARYNEYSVSIDLLDCKILKGNLPSKKLGIALDFVKDNKNYLLEKWNKYNNYRFKF